MSINLKQEYDVILREACANDAFAFAWVQQVKDLALLWDHLVDKDPIDVQLAETTLEAVLLQWPFNPFYAKNGQHLALVLSNVIAQWRNGNLTNNRLAQYALYLELPCAVAYIMGGAVLRDSVTPKIMALINTEIATETLAKAAKE